MAGGARIESVEVLAAFQAALWKFQTAANGALGDAESELRRTQIWLELEQDAYWKDQIRKRHDLVERAKEAVRMKKLFKDVSGRSPSAAEEEKALKLAMARLAEAEQKLVNVRHWIRAFQKETESYKGSVGRLATSVESLIPTGVHHLDKLASELQQYAAVSAPTAGAEDVLADAETFGAGDNSMARGTAPDHTDDASLPSDKAIPTPSPEERRNAKTITNLPLAVIGISDEQIAALTAQPITWIPPDMQTKVTVSSAVPGASKIILCHTEPTSPQDSGWCVVPAESEVDQWQSISMADLLEIREDWRDLMKLPLGFSVIINMGGMAAVRDAQERVVWRAPADTGGAR